MENEIQDRLTEINQEISTFENAIKLLKKERQELINSLTEICNHSYKVIKIDDFHRSYTTIKCMKCGIYE